MNKNNITFSLNLHDISSKINNLVYNIYDYVQESSKQNDTGLDKYGTWHSNDQNTPTQDVNDTINNYCKINCQRIIPDTSEYTSNEDETFSKSITDTDFNLSKKEYDTYNNNELTYIDYTKGGQCVMNKDLSTIPVQTQRTLDISCRQHLNPEECKLDTECDYIFPHTIDEHNLNNYKNYDASENIFTNIYSYNTDNCKRIDGCDVDNIKVFDVQHSVSQRVRHREQGPFCNRPPIKVSGLEHIERVWPRTPTASGGSSDYDHKDIYKCSRYCAINETCESIPDIADNSRYDDTQESTDYNNNDGSDPLGY